MKTKKRAGPPLEKYKASPEEQEHRGLVCLTLSNAKP